MVRSLQVRVDTPWLQMEHAEDFSWSDGVANDVEAIT
jgi:hypothetical protein